MIRVLFICRTNAVLSPLAAGLFNHLAQKHGLTSESVRAESRGSYPGNEPRAADRRALIIAQKQGFTVANHKTREVAAPDLTTASYVFCADEDSYWQVDRIAKEAGLAASKKFRLQLLTEESQQLGQRTIPDPLLGEASFDEVGELLAKYVTRLFERVVKAENLLLPS